MRCHLRCRQRSVEVLRSQQSRDIRAPLTTQRRDLEDDNVGDLQLGLRIRHLRSGADSCLNEYCCVFQKLLIPTQWRRGARYSSMYFSESESSTWTHSEGMDSPTAEVYLLKEHLCLAKSEAYRTTARRTACHLTSELYGFLWAAL